MLKFIKSFDHEIAIQPRWPSKYVYVTENAYRQLLQAQVSLLPHNIKLVLTRGYENESRFIRYMRRLMRWVGGAIFCIIYSGRVSERDEIFCPNGHDVSGDCIDVSIIRDQEILKFLPYGVFTSKKTLSAIRRTNDSTLKIVWRVLEESGFSIHENETEAMQIHCKLSMSP